MIRSRANTFRKIWIIHQARPENNKCISMKRVIMESRNFRDDPRIILQSWQNNHHSIPTANYPSICYFIHESNGWCPWAPFLAAFTQCSGFSEMQHQKQSYIFGESLLPFSSVKSKPWDILNTSLEQTLTFSACVTCFSLLLNQGQRY